MTLLYNYEKQAPNFKRKLMKLKIKTRRGWVYVLLSLEYSKLRIRIERLSHRTGTTCGKL